MMMLLIISMTSCQTTIENQITPVVIPVPVPPEKPSVIFEDIREMEEAPESGLYLSYEHGRDLARYLNDMEAHREELLAILDFYKQEKSPD